MREPRYSILADIQDAIEQAKQGKLALYWQRTIQREYRCKKVTPAEQQAYEQLQSGITPAQAGKSRPSPASEMPTKDYPRVGGEKIRQSIWYRTT